MKHTKLIYNFIVFGLLLNPSINAHATAQPLCGVLEKTSGSVQILNAERNKLLPSEENSSIPCGSWVLVDQGWAKIRHQEGSEIRLTNQTLIQLLTDEQDVKLTTKKEVHPSKDSDSSQLHGKELSHEPVKESVQDHEKEKVKEHGKSNSLAIGEHSSSHLSETESKTDETPHDPSVVNTSHQLPKNLVDRTNDDDIILYKGEIYIDVSRGNDDFQVVTPTARSRIHHGKALVRFSHETNSTHLIVLENTATLENRFATSKKVLAKEGESSELNFKLLRVIPLLPTLVSLAKLKPKLNEMQLSPSEQWKISRVFLKRQSHVFTTPSHETNAKEDLNSASQPSTSNSHSSAHTPLQGHKNLGQGEGEAIAHSDHSQTPQSIAHAQHDTHDKSEEQSQAQGHAPSEHSNVTQHEHAPEVAKNSPENHSKDETGEAPVSHGGRSIASVKQEKSVKKHNPSNNYIRHQPDEHDAHLIHHWEKKIVGGEEAALSTLHPNQSPSQTRNSIKNSKYNSNVKNTFRKSTSEDKRKLMEELSHIHSDD